MISATTMATATHHAKRLQQWRRQMKTGALTDTKVQKRKRCMIVAGQLRGVEAVTPVRIVARENDGQMKLRVENDSLKSSEK